MGVLGSFEALGGTHSAPCPAGFRRRLVAYVFDILLVAVAAALVTLVVAASWMALTEAHGSWIALRRVILGPNEALTLRHGPITITARTGIPISHVIPIAIFNVLAWLYFTLQESSTRGATIGKRLLRLRVTDERGNRITLARANARYWSKFFSDETFCAGYLVILFTPRKQALHDLVARTLVVIA